VNVLELNVFVLFDTNLLLLRVSRALKLFTARVKTTNSLLFHNMLNFDLRNVVPSFESVNEILKCGH